MGLTPLALQISCDLGELSQGGLEVFYDFGGDDVGVGEIGAVFERFIFKPDLNPLGAENETGRAERPTSWEARSQDVEVEFVALRSEFTNEREEL
jgi:hypothetical protein